MTDVEDEETINPSDFSSIDVGIKEVKEIFNREEERASTLERKITGLLAVDTILITVLSTMGDLNVIVKGVVIFVAGLSVLQCIRALSTFEYKRPFKKAKNVSAYISLEKEHARYEIFKLYIKSIRHNKSVNARRYTLFQWALRFTLLSLLLLVILPSIIFVIDGFSAPQAGESGNTATLFRE